MQDEVTVRPPICAAIELQNDSFVEKLIVALQREKLAPLKTSMTGDVIILKRDDGARKSDLETLRKTLDEKIMVP